MQILKTISCLLLLCVCLKYIYAQTVPSDVLHKAKVVAKNIEFIKTDSGLIINNLYWNSCKNHSIHSSFIGGDSIDVKMEYQKRKIKESINPEFLTVKGNISYDFLYRSSIDTPFAQQNLQQHTERVSLNILLKGKYPLKVIFTGRQSNSPYFKNFCDVNLNFDKYKYNQDYKQKLLNKLNQQLGASKMPNLAKLEAEIIGMQTKYNSIQNWVNDPMNLQKIIEERERIYFKKLKEEKEALLQVGKIQNPIKNTIQIPKKDSIQFNTFFNNREKKQATRILKAIEKIKDTIDYANSKKDSVIAPYAQLYEKKKKELDSIKQKITLEKRRVDSIKQKVQNNIAGIRTKIYRAADKNELQNIAEENGIDLDEKNKVDKILSNIKTLSIGRGLLNYTELTAQNVIITGVNIEYNPSWYAAFAAGKIDYAFRDFFNKKNTTRNQYIVMGRYGYGDINRNALIFSYFKGRKNNSNFSLDSLNNPINNEVNIMGYSVEAIIKEGENTRISAEFAKSTKPLIGNFLGTDDIKSLAKFNDKSNMGINIKAQTLISQTKTSLSGFYRKTGENFQSFSLFTYHANQTAWQAKLEQYFLKNKISVTAMLRANDFSNPFANQTYSSNTIFKTLIVNARFPKYPVVSLGYFPGTQLYVVNGNAIRENAFYIFSGSVVYSYRFKGFNMNSSFTFNKYNNQATDTGFVGYKGNSYYANQNIYFKKLQLQGAWTYNDQPNLQYYTMESSAGFNLKEWLQIGGGVKMNSVAHGNCYFGGKAQFSVNLKKMGVIQLQYEKLHYPTLTQALYPVETGRLSYLKIF